MNQKENFVVPNLQVLTNEQINELHNYSIAILENTGVKVESKTALEIFKKSDAVSVKGDVVFMSKDLIEHAIQTAPSNIEIFNQKGDHAFNLGMKQGRDTHFGIGVTNTWYQDIRTNKTEPFARKHMQAAAKLSDLLPNFDMISTPGVLSDINTNVADLYAALDMYANTSKAMVLLVLGDNQLQNVIDLLTQFQGNISEKPSFIPYFNPITPLVMNEATTDKMITAIENKLPFMYSNYSMYGGTTPASQGGTLAVLNAELLAGLVFSQLVKEGSKIILGSLPAAFNMKTMGSLYTPTSYLLNLTIAEMMHHYEIPHCGTSGSNIGRGPDILAAGDLYFNHLSSTLGKVGCAPFVGGNFDSMAFSPATVVLSDQIIGKARKFAAGFSLNDTSVNLTEINDIAHGGNYFTTEQTMASMDELCNNDSLWTDLKLDAWLAADMLSAEKELIDYTSDLYAQAESPSEESESITKKGEEFIQKRYA